MKVRSACMNLNRCLVYIMVDALDCNFGKGRSLRCQSLGKASYLCSRATWLTREGAFGQQIMNTNLRIGEAAD